MSAIPKVYYFEGKHYLRSWIEQIALRFVLDFYTMNDFFFALFV